MSIFNNKQELKDGFGVLVDTTEMVVKEAAIPAAKSVAKGGASLGKSLFNQFMNSFERTPEEKARLKSRMDIVKANIETAKQDVRDAREGNRKNK